MLRDKNLIPLSHQHQHALALCVRIERASPVAESDLPAWRGEIQQLFDSEIALHFSAEEQVLFPAAKTFRELGPLVDDLLADHEWLRERLAGVQNLASEEVRELAQRLSAHIRREERQLFEGIQENMSAEEVADIGRRLDERLKQASQTCILPTETTRLRPAK